VGTGTQSTPTSTFNFRRSVTEQGVASDSYSRSAFLSSSGSPRDVDGEATPASSRVSPRGRGVGCDASTRVPVYQPRAGRRGDAGGESQGRLIVGHRVSPSGLALGAPLRVKTHAAPAASKGPPTMAAAGAPSRFGRRIAINIAKGGAPRAERQGRASLQALRVSSGTSAILRRVSSSMGKALIPRPIGGRPSLHRLRRRHRLQSRRDLRLRHRP
jgi:hypothetical protein